MKRFATILALLFALQAACNAAPYDGKNYPTPPPEHPRLFLRSGDIPELKKKMETEEGKKILAQLRELSIPRSEDEEAATKDHGFRYYFQMRGKTSEVQLLALDYLVNRTPFSAKRAVRSMLDTLQKTSFGTKQDLSRASGVMLMVGGLVYDWCYDTMDDGTRQAYIKEFRRIAATMESGYPPKRDESVAGHLCEWMILRDMLSAGIAIYDEYPDMYNYVASLIYEKYVPVRNYIYQGHCYHQGTSYVGVRFTNDLISNWIMTRMGAGPLYSEDQRYVLYDAIYRSRPDGSVLPGGDENPVRRGYVKNYALPEMLAASYYHDPYLEYQYRRNPRMENHCLILELLWKDFDLKPKAPDDLPLTLYSPAPYGWMIARTGWGKESVIAEMKINEQFAGNHQHLDGGSFQIYYKGPLAIDSGCYQGSSGGYNSPHSKNYFKRTIAHNSLLIYDPDEVFECWNYGGEGKTKTAANDGGQRMPGEKWRTCMSMEELLSPEFTVGKEEAHWIGGKWSYLKGDITSAYSSKVSEVKRSFAFCNTGSAAVPAVMVVFDRVTAAKASFKKYFLLHSIEEPALSGNCYEIRRTLNKDSGMLHCSCLLPENASISKVGGPGKEFWVFGTNYPNDRFDPANERGAWRVEVCPSSEAETDLFLNVLEVGENGCQSFSKVEKIDSGPFVGAVLICQAVFFAKEGKVVGADFVLTLPAVSDGAAAGSAARGAVRDVLITDVAAGKWSVQFPDGTVRTIEVLPGENVINLPSCPAGKIRILREPLA